VRIVVAGALANKPWYGGEAWVRLAWVLGLRALGAKVLFIEELDTSASNGRASPACRPPGVRFFQEVCRRFGLEEHAALISKEGRTVTGLSMGAVLDFASDADLLVNISGHLAREEIFSAPRRRAYVDLDPGYTQFWHAAGVGDLRLDAHDVHFTVGANLGSPECAVPTSGISWIPVLPPVLLQEWPLAEPVEEERFTTVASWRGAYGAVLHAGRSYGLKVHEFRKLVSLPRRVPAALEIALDLHSSDAHDGHLMREHGWRLTDPRTTAGTPEAFRDYVRESAAEFSVAQGIYVETACGWFSDRSAHYLAAGRPVVVQDTGFGTTLPVGEGILAFSEVEDAAEAVRAAVDDRSRHSRAARQIAEELFDSSKVLSSFLERAIPPRRTFAPLVDRPLPPVPPALPTIRRTAPVVAVSGMVARVPGQGGATWAALQYVLGLRQLGYQVLFIEELDPTRLDPEGATLLASHNAAYFRTVTRRFGLGGMAALVLRGTRETVGMSMSELEQQIGPGSLLLNLSGSLHDPELLSRFTRRIYVDLDPAFTQIWHEVEGIDVGIDGHTHYATVGANVGESQCDIPTCGVPWIHICPPVVLDLWEPGAPLRRDAFTTVANWRAYGSVEWNGVHYGQKVHAFRELYDLPRRVARERFEVALAIHADETPDLEALSSYRWHVLDPARVAGSPVRFRRFVRESSAELGVAKTGYVRSRCGWFSDRSACYLAAGRPVLAQDTGFGSRLPTGEGLLPFTTVADAAEGVRAIRADYARHSRAARRLAEEYFDARKVLGRLLKAVA